MSRVQNRLVWANGFTNDKRHFSNKEPYQKKCSRCNKQIWMNPDKSGWKALDANGKSHECKAKVSGKKKTKKNRQYNAKCKYCESPILMKFTNNRWTPTEDGKRHRCPSLPDDIKSAISHMGDI